MKSFLKQNPLFVLVSLFSLVTFITTLYFSLELSSKTNELQREIKQVESELNDYQNSIINYSYIPSDYNAIKSDLTELSSTEKDLSNFADYILNERENARKKWSSKSAESVNAAITRLFSRMRKKCRESFIILPRAEQDSSPSSVFQAEKIDEADDSFGFSFSAYDGFWPSFSAEEARKLGTQSEIISDLIEHLSVCTDANHSIEIISIKREVVGEIDKANIGTDALNLAEISPLLLRNLDEIDSYAFKISLKTQTIPLRKLVNKLRPPFLLREILINPVEENTANNFAQSSFSPDPFSTKDDPEEKFVPIVSKVDSHIELVVEYIVESKRDLSSIITSLANHSDPHPEVLYDWLKQSGEESLVKEAQNSFNEAGSR